MQARAVDLALVAALVTASGCAHHVAVGQPGVFPAPASVSLDHVRGAVLAGMAARSFVPEGEEPGMIVAGWTSRRLWMRVRIHYSADRYAIEYLASGGLGESVDSDGVRRINARYHRYIDRLRLAIDAGFARPMMMSRWQQPVAATPPAAVPSLVASGSPEDVPPPPGAEVAPPPDPAVAVPDPGTPPDPVVVAPDPSPTQESLPAPPAPPAAPVALPPPVILPGSPLAAPLPAETPPQRSVPTHPFWELAGAGAAVLAGAWVANWTAALGVGSSDGEYIALSFIPLGGPWAQLAVLKWAIHPRWTGAFHPAMGLVQVAGLAMLVTGLFVHVPGDESGADGSGMAWTLTPSASPEGGGLSFGLRY